MALIERLEHADWEDFLRNTFRFTLEVLQEDRFASVGSSADDLRSWLTAGGVARVREHLAEQMPRRGLSADRQAAITHCLADLVTEHRGALLNLMAAGVIPGSTQECLAACGLSEDAFADLIARTARGERPFEAWMFAHGHSADEIADMYRLIDRWLLETGIAAPPFPPPPSRH